MLGSHSDLSRSNRRYVNKHAQQIEAKAAEQKTKGIYVDANCRSGPQSRPFSARIILETPSSPRSKALPLKINSINNTTLHTNIAFYPRTGVAFGLPLSIQSLPISIGLRWGFN